MFRLKAVIGTIQYTHAYFLIVWFTALRFAGLFNWTWNTKFDGCVTARVSNLYDGDAMSFLVPAIKVRKVKTDPFPNYLILAHSGRCVTSWYDWYI